MQKLPLKLEKSLESRKQEQAFRSLKRSFSLIDFSSNDYFGLSSSEKIYNKAHEILKENKLLQNGATGSRLLSGNHILYDLTENYLAEFHQTEAALIFNSGYDANIGFFASVPKRGDLIFYDELVHASIRDGIGMSHAKAYKFHHNNPDSLQNKLSKIKKIEDSVLYIVTESVFSMDGDMAPLEDFTRVSEQFGAFLIVDEAHATGIFGEKGEGLVQDFGIQDKVFARLNTFGKAPGCHGAVILGSKSLKDYLVNYSRSFIYTTALPPHSVATILAVYQEFEKGIPQIQHLKNNIQFFRSQVSQNNLSPDFLQSKSAIQSCIIPGNEEVKNVAESLKKEGFEVKPILSPTVPKGQERLRFCLHSFNSEEEISRVLKILAKLLA
ncbi:aminotransferase class I/II-fold pyridoxal phosphate-dependent enzyme [Salegentibacter salarius]|uniref:8-amino-7-oxononanoate synthase n=1 Tax=Salegentibacter salarius TaxID=435906 RepID=A0A2N0TV28_9FLAO|nr:pyridoxal phosphate-dependent aminotransferase family protein [Salegentibacter salarius]OEY72279.1 8-amino-7-oxononanoate synthase [Salegentibacter salarius]PKD18600.1 8-amino-7-oxononanoate synthase [Salegentibacter salarius]SLJ88482.1 8-amino-7-oxononanoate synthase [Salegentibacter salarius]